MSNAVKYQRKIPGQTINLVLRANDKEAILTVKDNGICLKKADLDKIFDRFYRVKDSTAPGTGLGLSLTKAMVERNGGTINFQSVYGEGTTCQVTFPLARSEI